LLIYVERSQQTQKAQKQRWLSWFFWSSEEQNDWRTSSRTTEERTGWKDEAKRVAGKCKRREGSIRSQRWRSRWKKSTVQFSV